MTRTIPVLFAALFAAAAFAAPPVQEAQTPGSERPKAVAEDIHNARQHGLEKAKVEEAQAPGDARAQARAENLHLQKQHGNINDSADQRMMRDASRL